MKRLEGNAGITLVALVVTIVVLLILAGITLTFVFGDNGVFQRAAEAKEKTAIAKAREKLELTLDDALIIKHGTEGLTDEQLTAKINEVGEEIGERENPNISKAIVDGYIFSIDRTMPKILDYLGKADGVIITAIVSGNNGWVSAENARITISGIIKTYSGGSITTVSAKNTTNGVTTDIAGFSIDGDGRYSIEVIESCTITIDATDSKGKSSSKSIPVQIKIDRTGPTVENVTAEVEMLTIKFRATGHDKNLQGQEESGIAHFNYTISSTQDTVLEGIPEDKRTGTFKQNEIVEIETSATGNREQTTYTIAVTATDNCGNITKTPTVQSIKTEKITISVDKEFVYMAIGENEIVTANSNVKDKTFEWKSDNAEIADVSQAGVITGKKVGIATITVAIKGKNNIYCSVTVRVGEEFDYINGEATLIPSGAYSANFTRLEDGIGFSILGGWNTNQIFLKVPTGATSCFHRIRYSGIVVTRKYVCENGKNRILGKRSMERGREKSW